MLFLYLRKPNLPNSKMDICRIHFGLVTIFPTRELYGFEEVSYDYGSPECQDNVCT